MKRVTVLTIIAFTFLLYPAWFSNWGNGPGVQSCIAGTLIKEKLKITDITHNSPMYYDVKTNHKYIENNDNTYSEFTQKGVLLKIVRTGSRSLTDHPYIRPISNNTILLYKKKNTDGNPNFRVLYADKPHPKGWYLDKALYPME
jgi:hypothetical protein